MTRAVKQISSFRGIQIKKDAGDHDDSLFQAFLKEIQPVADRDRQATEVQPNVEGRVWHPLDVETDLLQAAQNIISLRFEVPLERLHLMEHFVGFEHGNGGFLKWDIGTAVQVGAARANRADVFLGTNHPGDAPSGEAEPFRQAIDEQNVIFVHVFDVVGGADGSPVASGGVVVTAVELVHDQGGPATTDILDFGQFGVADHLTGRIARVRGQNDAGSAYDASGRQSWPSCTSHAAAYVKSLRQSCRDGWNTRHPRTEARERRQTADRQPFFRLMEDQTCIPKQGEHFVVGGVVRNEETEVGIVQDGSNADQARPPSGDDGHILPGIFALFALAVMYIVEVRHRHPQWLDPGRGAVFSAGDGNVNLRRALEAPFDLIIHLGRSLAQVRPLGRVIGEAKLDRPLGTPHHARRGSGGIKSGVGAVTLVSTTKLTMDFGIEFTVG